MGCTASTELKGADSNRHDQSERKPTPKFNSKNKSKIQPTGNGTQYRLNNNTSLHNNVDTKESSHDNQDESQAVEVSMGTSRADDSMVTDGKEIKGDMVTFATAKAARHAELRKQIILRDKKAQEILSLAVDEKERLSLSSTMRSRTNSQSGVSWTRPHHSTGQSNQPPIGEHQERLTSTPNDKASNGRIHNPDVISEEKNTQNIHENNNQTSTRDITKSTNKNAHSLEQTNHGKDVPLPVTPMDTANHDTPNKSHVS